MELPVYVLSGGKSSRFGGDKARAMLCGQPLLVHVVSQLQGPLDQAPGGPEPLRLSASHVITSTPGQYDDLGLISVPDQETHLGPLGGLYTALCHLSENPTGGSGWCFLVSCDMAGIRREWVHDLWQARTPESQVVAFGPDPWDSMFALYHVDLLPQVEAQLQAGKRAMWRLIEAAPHVCVPHPSDWHRATSINTPDDLRRHRERAQEPGVDNVS